MMGYIALAYIIFFILVFGIFYLKKLVVVNNGMFKTSLFLFAIMLGIVTIYFEPLKMADLFRQFVRIEKLQGTSFSTFSQTMFDDTMWGENLIYWIFSRFKKVEWYPLFFTTLIVGSAMFMIIKPYDEEVPTGVLLISIIVFFAGNNLSSIFGGVRNRFVNGIIIFCLYEMIVENKRKLLRLFIMFFCCVVHVSGIATLLFSGLAFILKGRKKISFVFIPLFYSAAMQIMSGIENRNVQFMVLKMKYYFEESYALSPHILMGYFLMLLFVLLSIWSIPNNSLTCQEQKYANVVECFTLFGGVYICTAYHGETSGTLLLRNFTFARKNCIE